MACIVFSSPGAKIGADPSLTGALTWLEWEEFFLKDPKNFTLQPIIQNPIDDIWFDRPQRPKEELEIHDIKFSGRSRLKTFKYYVTSSNRLANAAVIPIFITGHPIIKNNCDNGTPSYENGNHSCCWPLSCSKFMIIIFNHT